MDFFLLNIAEGESAHFIRVKITHLISDKIRFSHSFYIFYWLWTLFRLVGSIFKGLFYLFYYTYGCTVLSNKQLVHFSLAFQSLSHLRKLIEFKKQIKYLNAFIDKNCYPETMWMISGFADSGLSSDRPFRCQSLWDRVLYPIRFIFTPIHTNRLIIYLSSPVDSSPTTWSVSSRLTMLNCEYSMIQFESQILLKMSCHFSRIIQAARNYMGFSFVLNICIQQNLLS